MSNETQRCIECGSENTVAVINTFMGMGDYAVCAQHAADHGISGYENKTIANTVSDDADNASNDELEAAADLLDTNVASYAEQRRIDKLKQTERN